MNALILLVLLVLSSVLSGCGGQVGGSDPQQDLGATTPTQDRQQDRQESVACSLLDLYWQGLHNSGCTGVGPGSAALETAAEGASCAQSVAALDACFSSADCRLLYEAKLLDTCKGLVPYWPTIRAGK